MSSASHPAYFAWPLVCSSRSCLTCVVPTARSGDPRISPKFPQDVQEHARFTLRTKNMHLDGIVKFGYRAASDERRDDAIRPVRHLERRNRPRREGALFDHEVRVRQLRRRHELELPRDAVGPDRVRDFEARGARVLVFDVPDRDDLLQMARRRAELHGAPVGRVAEVRRVRRSFRHDEFDGIKVELGQHHLPREYGLLAGVVREALALRIEARLPRLVVRRRRGRRRFHPSWFFGGFV